MAIIVDAVWRCKNDSEYQLDQAKQRARPVWLEETDGYRDRATATDDQVTRHYRCPWSRRIEARQWLLGYSGSILVPDPGPVGGVGPPVGDTGKLGREIPAQDPERPWLFCSEAEVMRGEGAWVESPDVLVLGEDGEELIDPDTRVRPWRAPAIAYVANDQGGDVGHKQLIELPGRVIVEQTTPPSERFSDGRALIRATYRPRDYTILSDEDLDRTGRDELRRHVTRQIDYGLEAIPLARLAQNGTVLKFAEGKYKDNVIPEAGVQQAPIATLHYTWQEVPDPPHAAFTACLGRVNADPFDGFGGAPVYPAETLLCMPWKLDRKCGPTGRVSWQIHYRLSYRPQKWNRFPAADGNFYLATWGGLVTGDRAYKTADFGALFRAPPPLRYRS